jgi:hypothetical protein
MCYNTVKDRMFENPVKYFASSFGIYHNDSAGPGLALSVKGLE